LSAASADGVIEIVLQNTSSVGPICGVNRHTVTLSYGGAPIGSTTAISSSETAGP